jgi:hypothetical protein
MLSVRNGWILAGSRGFGAAGGGRSRQNGQAGATIGERLFGHCTHIRRRRAAQGTQ